MAVVVVAGMGSVVVGADGAGGVYQVHPTATQEP